MRTPESFLLQAFWVCSGDPEFVEFPGYPCPLQSPMALTQADEHPLQGLVGGGLQVEKGELVICAQLSLVADGFEQGRCPVELRGEKIG